jgi:hypothetical protein
MASTPDDGGKDSLYDMRHHLHINTANCPRKLQGNVDETNTLLSPYINMKRKNKNYNSIKPLQLKRHVKNGNIFFTQRCFHQNVNINNFPKLKTLREISYYKI